MKIQCHQAEKIADVCQVSESDIAELLAYIASKNECIANHIAEMLDTMAQEIKFAEAKIRKMEAVL